MAEITFPDFIEAIQTATTNVGTADQHLAIAEHVTETAENAIELTDAATNVILQEAEDFVLDNVVSAWEEAERLVAQHRESAEEAVERCREALGQCSQLVLALDQVVARHSGEIDQEFREMQGVVRAFGAFLLQEEREFEQAAQSFERETVQFEEALEAFAQEFEQGLDRFRSEVDQQHKQTLDRVSKVLMDHVGQREPEHLQSAFRSFHDLGEQSYRGFDDESRSLGDELQQRIEQIMEEVARHVETTLKREAEDRFEELIEDAMEALIKEVGECLVQMGIGGQISGAIAPAVPMIVAAQKAAMVLRMGVKVIDSVF